MRHKIFGNNEYYISKDGVISNVVGKVCTLDQPKPGRVRISINGVRRLMDLKWLRDSAIFELKLPLPLQDDFRHIRFVPIQPEKLGHKADVLMIFDKPFAVDNEYRIIPNYPQLAVTNDGRLQVWESLTEIDPWLPKNKKYYPTVQAYDPIVGTERSLLLHRLVALAWCEGHSAERWMVNHKDGNKHNYHADNLEWVTPSENNKHAFKEALRSDNVFTIVHDCKNWEVHTFATMSEACRWMNVEPRYIENFDFARPSKIIKDRYEIRFGNDRTPWVYKKGDAIRAGRYTITVDYQGEIKTFHDRRDFQSDMGVWNVSNIDEALERGRLLHPNAKITYVDNYETTQIQYINVVTREIGEGDTIAEVARALGLHKSNVRNALAVGESRSFSGYAFRYKTNDVWSTDIKDAPSRTVCIQARHITTNEIMTFDSLRVVSEHFNKDRSVFKSRLNTNKDFEGWVFKEM